MIDSQFTETLGFSQLGVCVWYVCFISNHTEGMNTHKLVVVPGGSIAGTHIKSLVVGSRFIL